MPQLMIFGHQNAQQRVKSGDFVINWRDNLLRLRAKVFLKL